MMHDSERQVDGVYMVESFIIDKTRGINDKRRNSVRKYGKDVDAFLYLDSDLVFPYPSFKT